MTGYLQKANMGEGIAQTQQIYSPRQANIKGTFFNLYLLISISII